MSPGRTIADPCCTAVCKETDLPFIGLFSVPSNALRTRALDIDTLSFVSVYFTCQSDCKPKSLGTGRARVGKSAKVTISFL